jgi:DNA-binding NtrC family response regulator
MKAHVLLVEDDRAMCDLIVGHLGRRGFDAVARPSAMDARAVLESQDIDVIITDHHMSGTTGIAFCTELSRERPHLPVVVITAFGSLDTAIGAIRAGAYDFLPKPFDLDQLVLVLERALAHRQLTTEVKRLRGVVAEAARFEDILGESPAIRATCELVARAARSDATVVITGESGTGKDLVARALHRRGARRDRPFVAINCAAVTDSLLESELFGHKRGAFTDARDSRPGLLVQAHGGTVFLDEIGEMPLAMQAKLLRTLETKTVRPVGSDTEVPFDVRIIAATNRDLESDSEEGRFRRDLFFRLNVIQIGVPSLRVRGSDILLLAQHFVRRAAARSGKPVTGIATTAAERLLAYPWPGNVRELQNAIERAVALCSFDRIAPEDLPERVRTYRRSQLVVAGDDPSALLPMHELERRYVKHVLNTVNGNKTVAARILGFDRRTMYRKLERYDREALEDSTGEADDCNGDRNGSAAGSEIARGPAGRVK